MEFNCELSTQSYQKDKDEWDHHHSNIDGRNVTIAENVQLLVNEPKAAFR